MSFTRIYDANDLWSGQMVAVVADGINLLLVNIDDKIYAYEDRCAHQAMPLSRGTLTGSVLRCAAHHWEFDVTTGFGVNPQAAKLRQFHVKRIGDDVFVDLEGRA